MLVEIIKTAYTEIIIALSKSRLVFNFCILILIFVSSFVYAEEQISTKIIIKPDFKINVDGDRIYLRDIAYISGDKKITEEIGDICLGYAPKPGYTKRISGRRINYILKTKDWIANDTIIEIPDSITIERSFQTISDDALKEILVKYIEETLGSRDYKVYSLKTRGISKFPTGKMELIYLPSNDIDIKNQLNLRILVNVDGKECTKITLSAKVGIYKDVACALRSISRDTILTEDDVCLEKKDISRMPDNVVTSLSDIIGKQVNQNVSSKSYLRSNMIEEPPIVLKGSKVSLVAKKGLVKVVTYGVAASDGRLGEEIEIENLSSKKVVIGRVKDKSTIEVIF
ncbi:MAG: flagellar basal body P-ring formation protein FlgA [Desulfobacterales bacterium]|nr:flagellar basal body P-ring formation protein FlgA [Desulfobacterales bacterium]